MLEIKFYPEAGIPRFIEAAEEYTKIWNEDGKRITEVIEIMSGSSFRADMYSAIILDNKPSSSYPLILRSSYTLIQKKATLIHELTHKVIQRNDDMKVSELENHKVLDLILYDIWVAVYGESFADASVEDEKVWSDTYKDAWNYALSFTKEERVKRYNEFLVSPK